MSDAGLPASTLDLSGPHAGELASDTSHAGSANLACESARVETLGDAGHARRGVHERLRRLLP